MKQKVNTLADAVKSLWRLMVTLASALGAYILIPQQGVVYKVTGVVLLISAANIALVHYVNPKTGKK